MAEADTQQIVGGGTPGIHSDASGAGVPVTALTRLEAGLAFTILIAATAGAMVEPNPISGDALIGLYASILGYVFGRKTIGRNGGVP